MGQPRLQLCGTICRGGVPEGTVPLAQLLVGFQSLPLLPTSKLGPSGADSQVGGFMYILGYCGSLQQTLLWGWIFLLPPQHPQVFPVRGLRLYFPSLEPWVVWFVSLPGCPSQLILTQMWGIPVYQLLVCFLQTGSLSPPLLPVWMNVTSLTPWLLDFHAVWFSGSFRFLFFF